VSAVNLLEVALIHPVVLLYNVRKVAHPSK
jgi:hypothetical protein